MSATIYQITGRNRELDAALVNFSEFQVDDGRTVPAQIVIDEAGWHPYCLDDANRRMIFTKIDPEIDMSREVFMYMRQFSDAEQLLAIPYDKLPELAAQVKMPETLVFIFSIGRCGTTLLNQIFNEIEGAYSLSEPDIPTVLFHMRAQAPQREEEYKMLIETSTCLQIHATAQNHIPIFGMKFRSQATGLVDLYNQTFPDAKNIFMYRNTGNWMASFYRMFKRYFDTTSFTVEELMNLGIVDILLSRQNIERYIPLNGSHLPIHLEEILVCMLLDYMEHYQASFESGMTWFALHYEQLLADKEKNLKSLFEFCNISSEHLAEALHGFDQDAQRGTTFSQANEEESAINYDEQLERFETTLRKHSSFKTLNFLLPDIHRAEMLYLDN